MSKQKPKQPVKRQSLWKGYFEDGITYSLLCKFLVCPERFRLKVVEGLREEDGFKHAMMYGSMWHECEEAHANGDAAWSEKLTAYSQKLLEEYPTADKEILKWTAICRMQFPQYINYWRKHDIQRKRVPLIEEKAYRIPYQLPSGRTVTLRGKIDSVFLIPSRKGGSIYVQENKTKGKIDELGLQRTVSKNLQTMIYHIALKTLYKDYGENQLHLSEDFHKFYEAIGNGATITGTLYNVIRRPLSDRNAIKQKKSEDLKAFLKRLGTVIADKPADYFKRWQIVLSSQEVETFERQCFIPCLERLCDWWDSIKDHPFDPWTSPQCICPSHCHDECCPVCIAGIKPEINKLHYQFPYGVYNSLTDGMHGDFHEYLSTGSKSSLVQVTNLFPELETE